MMERWTEDGRVGSKINISELGVVGRKCIFSRRRYLIIDTARIYPGGEREGRWTE
jgi:hypothetical protein